MLISELWNVVSKQVERPTEIGRIFWWTCLGKHTHNALTCIVLKLACSNYPAAELLGWQEWKWVPIIKCTTEKIEHYRRSTMGLMLLCHSSINAKRLRKALIFQLFHRWFQFKRKASTWYHSSQWDASKNYCVSCLMHSNESFTPVWNALAFLSECETTGNSHTLHLTTNKCEPLNKVCRLKQKNWGKEIQQHLR